MSYKIVMNLIMFIYWTCLLFYCVNEGNDCFVNLTDDGTTQIFDPPLLFNVETDPREESPLPNNEHSNLLSNVSAALAHHMQMRKNKWRSQLDGRIIPLWFPCANFWHCSQTNGESNNFSDLFDSDYDVT